MVGFPGGIYAKGPTYGVWFLGYILLAYPIGYFVGPKIWEAGKRHNAITLPDLFKGHYRSRGRAGRCVRIDPVPDSVGQLQFTGNRRGARNRLARRAAVPDPRVRGARVHLYRDLRRARIGVHRDPEGHPDAARDRRDGRGRRMASGRRASGVRRREPAGQQHDERIAAALLDEHDAVPVARLPDAVRRAEFLHRARAGRDPAHAGRDAAVHADVSVPRDRVVLRDHRE